MSPIFLQVTTVCFCLFKIVVQDSFCFFGSLPQTPTSRRQLRCTRLQPRWNLWFKCPPPRWIHIVPPPAKNKSSMYSQTGNTDSKNECHILTYVCYFAAGYTHICNSSSSVPNKHNKGALRIREQALQIDNRDLQKIKWFKKKMKTRQTGIALFKKSSLYLQVKGALLYLQLDVPSSPIAVRRHD